MKSEFTLAFNQICAEHSLSREVVLDALRAALVTAYKRDWKVPQNQNVTAEINFDTGLARIFMEKLVVDTVNDPESEVTLQRGRKVKPDVQLGDYVLLDVTPHNFGRIAAQTAKQVITQRLREAERESQFNHFSRQEGEIIIGTIQAIKPTGYTLHLERREEAHLPKNQQIAGEHYTLHQKIRVYVLEVRRTSRGPEIVVSRSHPRMLRRMLELEVPEIRNGQVEICAIAREAGSRSKVAVLARQAGLDAVGACVGMRGIRIQTISNELHGERIDVIEWSNDAATYISNALSMRQVLDVTLDEDNPGGRTASVVVSDDQLSLAIGRAGQNARLAAKLTGWRIDIQGATEAAAWALGQVNETPGLIEDMKETAPLIPKLVALMRTHEKERYPYNDEERRIIKTVVHGVRLALIAQRGDQDAARASRGRRAAQELAEATRAATIAQARATVPAEAYNIPLDTLNVTDKVREHLSSSNIMNVGQIMERLALGDEEVLMLQGIGAKALREIKDAIIEIREQIPEVEFAPVSELLEETPVLLVEAETLLQTESEESETAEVEALLDVAVEEVVAPVGATPVEPFDEVAPVAAVEPQEAVASVEKPAEAVEEAFVLPQVEPLAGYDYDDEDTLDDTKGKKKGKRNKRDRAMFLDEKTGETYVVRKRRRQQSGWNEYEDL